MAKKETTKKETKTKSTSTKKQSPKETKVEEKIVEEIVIEEPKVQETKPQPKIKKQRDFNELIRVVNICNSKLTYISKSQPGYRIDWDEYGEENYMEYKELINMRSSQRKFFEEPWIICDYDVLEDLKVDKYYKNIIDLENIDDIFKKKPEDLKKILEVVPNGIKTLIIDRALELRKEKKLDSISIIETIEKTLKVDLTV